MLLYLQGKKTDDGYKRKKLKLSTSIVNNALDMSSDMDIEDTGGGIIQLSKFQTYSFLFIC